jgi:hypothetical protein
MPTDNQLASRYIARGLALIRAANGMSRGVDAKLLKLGSDIRYLIACGAISDLGKRALNALLSDIADAIYQRYNDIIDDQGESLRELIDVEAEFAQKAGLNNKPSDAQLAGVFAGLLILGSSLKDLWRKLAGDFLYKTSAAVKAAQRTQAVNETALSAIFGESRRNAQVAGVGGELGLARRAAVAAVQTGAHAASQDARLATFSANGIKYIEWHAILDAKVCPECAIRAGKLWTLPDVSPVGHDVPYVSIPIHPWDRCITLPHSGAIPEDGGPGLMQFDDWLKTLSDEQENELLGVGRADLYRRKVITLNDLLNQSGQLMTLAELRALT